MAATAEQAESAEKTLNEKLKLFKPNHGIVFKIALQELFGSRNCSKEDKNEEESVMTENTHQAVFVIVDRGNAEAVIEAAEQAGARGATIINARGAGTHETSKLFAMAIEPEKEIVLMITEKDRTDSINTAIRSSTGLDQPGKGILFVVDVAKTLGLY
jgi:nitrogen regulatory protein PII